MKKIISILFFLCFINCNFINAQRIPLRLPKVPTRFTIPKVETTTAARAAVRAEAAARAAVRAEAAARAVVGAEAAARAAVRAETAARVATRTVGKEVLPGTLQGPPKRQSPSFNNSSRYGIPSELDYDMENRGFIKKEHIYSPSDNSTLLFETTENKDITVPSSLNSHASPPKVNLEKLRLKVMMKQNRLNKNEMKTDEFIFIGLLINQNEYGEYYVTNYAA